MMLFQRNQTEHIRNFHINTGSSGNPIAYGPGSIINGKFFLSPSLAILKQDELSIFIRFAYDYSG